MIKVIDFLVGGHRVDFIYNQNTPTTQAKKSMKSGRFLGGGRRSYFMSTVKKLKFLEIRMKRRLHDNSDRKPGRSNIQRTMSRFNEGGPKIVEVTGVQLVFPY